MGSFCRAQPPDSALGPELVVSLALLVVLGGGADLLVLVEGLAVEADFFEGDGGLGRGLAGQLGLDRVLQPHSSADAKLPGHPRMVSACKHECAGARDADPGASSGRQVEIETPVGCGRVVPEH
ncbi:MAG: hypothetical protein JWO25_253, partial [Alphaproteobacteria bacterium]|nr:hypothetical protein [Alphaproteobacteria bacterium]